ncbi:UNVERIFIED_CONTAM: Lipase 4 [Trichonephila clavipes]
MITRGKLELYSAEMVTVHGGIKIQNQLCVGIPYAQPPVGNLRWKKPFPLWTNASWCRSKNHFKATSFGSACFQLNPFLKQYEGQEDCLYLNVWTPTMDPEQDMKDS